MNHRDRRSFSSFGVLVVGRRFTSPGPYGPPPSEGGIVAPFSRVAIYAGETPAVRLAFHAYALRTRRCGVKGNAAAPVSALV